MSNRCQVIFRVDVDTPTASLILNKVQLKLNYLQYLNNLIDLMAEFGIRGTFMFIPNRTTPPADIVGRILDTGSEIGLHAVEVLPDRLRREKSEMEEKTGSQICGLSYHGWDLLDFVLSKLTRKSRYVAYHNPFASLLAGFCYDATGYPYVRSPLEFLYTSDTRILLFKACLTITHKRNAALVLKSYRSLAGWAGFLQDGLNVFMIHPNHLGRYGFRSAKREVVRAVFDHVVKHGAEVRTYAEVCSEVCSEVSSEDALARSRRV